MTGPHLSDFLFYLLQAAQFEEGCTARPGIVHSGPEVLVGQLVEKGAQFIVQVALDAGPGEQIAQEAGPAAEERHWLFRSARLERAGDG